MTEVEPEERSFHDYLEELFDAITSLQVLSDPDEHFRKLVAAEDALETVLNWIKLEKRLVQNYEVMVDWIKKLALDTTLTRDNIRNRLRVMVLPQAESFTQNLVLGEKSARKVLDAVTKDLEELPNFIKSFQEDNFKMLSAIGFDPEAELSYLDIALHSLVFPGRTQEFEKILALLRSSAKKNI